MAKGGKGRKGGGGGGGKTRKYTRDNNGRFASTGTGATARGGRLLTAKGNKRKTQTMEAGGAKAAGTIKGKLKRDPGAAGKIGKAKAAAPSTKAKSPKFVTEQSGRVRRAALGGGRTAIVRANSATIINAKGEPIMTRKGLPNITAGKKWAANPNARGPRLMRNKFASEAAPSRDFARTSRSAGTTRKPRGTIKGKVKRDPGAAGKIGQSKAAAKPASAAKANPLKRNPQSKDAQADRLNVADRKQKAKALLAISKPARKAIRISQLAQRAGFAGAGVSTDGRGKGRSSSAISNIQDGRMLLMGDFGKRKDKMTPGRRQSMESTMIKSGRSLQARLRTTEIGARVKGMGGDRKTMAAAAKPKGVITKAKSKPVPATKPARAARTPKTGQEVMKSEVRKVQNKNKRTPDEAKVKRMAERFQAKGAAPESSSKVKRLNTIETRQRAMAFLAKPNSKGSDRVGAVAQNIAKRKTYSTLTPNRNKPMARNSLGQKTIREQERKTAQGVATTRMQDTKKATQRVASPEPTTPRAKAASAQRIENSRSARKSANAAKAAANEVKYFRKDSDSQAYKNALAKRDRTLALRSPGTNKIAFRSRRMAIAAQRQRVNNVVERTNINLDRKRGQGLRKTSTGMTQLGLMGPGKKLFRVRRITGIKRPSGSKLAKRTMR